MQIKTVSKIEYFDEEEDVYDLTVEDDHTYVANETMSHNSCAVNHMAYTMASAGFRVCIVSLEMSRNELMQRRLAYLTGMTLTELKHLKFSSNRVEEYLSKFEDYQTRIKELGGCEDWKCEGNDLNVEELLYSLKPFDYDVIFIDYIGLLKGVGGDNQWQKLGEAARFCKIFAEENKMNVIACAQLSKEGEIRYSQAMLEHASNSFTWVYGKKEMESGVIEVEQKKGRMSERFNFYLRVNFATMSMVDLEGYDKEQFLSSQKATSQPQAFKSSRTGFFKSGS